MKLYHLVTASSVALSLLFVGSVAHAYSFDGSALASPDSANYIFNSTSKSATLSFDLLGYKSLDGNNDNGYEDFFSLKVNGQKVFAGSFSLGGQGDNIFVSTGEESYISNYKGGTFSWDGGSLTVTLPVDLNLGSNTLTFAYASRIPQGLRDEGWGIKNISMIPGVPEPEYAAMLLAGLMLVGYSVHRNRVKVPA